MIGINYRGYIIRLYYLPQYSKYEFSKEDWDEGDFCGLGSSIEDCKNQIDNYLD